MFALTAGTCIYIWYILYIYLYISTYVSIFIYIIFLYFYIYIYIYIRNNLLDTVVLSFTPNPSNPPWAYHMPWAYPWEGHWWRGQLCGCHALGSQATGWARADWQTGSDLAGFWADVSQETEVKHWQKAMIIGEPQNVLLILRMFTSATCFECG